MLQAHEEVLSYSYRTFLMKSIKKLSEGWFLFRCRYNIKI